MTTHQLAYDVWLLAAEAMAARPLPERAAAKLDTARLALLDVASIIANPNS